MSDAGPLSVPDGVPTSRKGSVGVAVGVGKGCEEGTWGLSCV